MLDKDGHNFRLNIDSRCNVTYEGNYDNGIHFVFSYKRNSDLKHYDIFEPCVFYPGQGCVVISPSTENYIQYFDGRTKKIDNDKLGRYVEELILQRKPKN